MVRLTFSILLFVFSTDMHSQRKYKIFYQDYVECFHDINNNKPIDIFDKIDGKVISSLEKLKDKNCYYKFAISKSEKGWLKIENLIVLPACENHILNENINQFRGKWIKAGCMKINLPHTTPESGITYTFYEKPNIESKKILKVNGFNTLDLLRVKKTWAYVKINHKGNEYFGWIERKYQCAYPWTNCIINK